jgi:hypothetical protein
LDDPVPEVLGLGKERILLEQEVIGTEEGEDGEELYEGMKPGIGTKGCFSEDLGEEDRGEED